MADVVCRLHELRDSLVAREGAEVLVLCHLHYLILGSSNWRHHAESGIIIGAFLGLMVEDFVHKGAYTAAARDRPSERCGR